MNVQFRNRTEAPTEPGLYWARPAGVYPKDPEPVRVYHNGQVAVLGQLLYGRKADFEWFGPVDMVKEG